MNSVDENLDENLGENLDEICRKLLFIIISDDIRCIRVGGIDARKVFSLLSINIVNKELVCNMFSLDCEDNTFFKSKITKPIAKSNYSSL
jgi:hypothetical protein